MSNEIKINQENINILFQKLNGFDNTNWLVGRGYFFDENGLPSIYTSETTEPLIFEDSTLNINNRTISNLSIGINPNDAINKNQLDEAISNINKSGNNIVINNHFVGEIRYTNTDLGANYEDEFQNIWTKTINNIGASILIADDSNVNTISMGSIPQTSINGVFGFDLEINVDSTFIGDSLPAHQHRVQGRGVVGGAGSDAWNIDSWNGEDNQEYVEPISSGTPTGSINNIVTQSITNKTLNIDDIGSESTNNAYGIYRYEYILTEKGVDSIISNDVFNPDDYPTNDEMNNAINEAISNVNIDLSDYYTKSEVDNLIPDTSNFVTQIDIDNSVEGFIPYEKTIDLNKFNIVDESFSDSAKRTFEINTKFFKISYSFENNEARAFGINYKIKDVNTDEVLSEGYFATEKNFLIKKNKGNEYKREFLDEEDGSYEEQYKNVDDTKYFRLYKDSDGIEAYKDDGFTVWEPFTEAHFTTKKYVDEVVAQNTGGSTAGILYPSRLVEEFMEDGLSVAPGEEHTPTDPKFTNYNEYDYLKIFFFDPDAMLDNFEVQYIPITQSIIPFPKEVNGSTLSIGINNNGNKISFNSIGTGYERYQILGITYYKSKIDTTQNGVSIGNDLSNYATKDDIENISGSTLLGKNPVYIGGPIRVVELKPINDYKKINIVAKYKLNNGDYFNYDATIMIDGLIVGQTYPFYGIKNGNLVQLKLQYSENAQNPGTFYIEVGGSGHPIDESTPYYLNIYGTKE